MTLTPGRSPVSTGTAGGATNDLPMPATVIEVAVETPAEAVVARAAGAQRVELCSDLAVGGVTPSAGALAAACMFAGVPVAAMVRPRSGDFVYSSLEVEVMLRDVRAARRAGAAIIVSGALGPDGGVDAIATAALVAAARPLPFTFHRAFDATPDRAASMEVLLALGVERVLSAGGPGSAAEGAELLARLVRQAGRHLTVIAGGGVRSGNVAALVRETGVREVHLGPRRARPQAAQAAPDFPATPPSVGAVSDLDADEVAAVVAALGG